MASPRVAVDDLKFAVDRLIEQGRAFTAMQLLSLHIEGASGALLLRVLDAVRKTPIAGDALPSTQHFGFDLERIMERLDAAGVDATDIGRLEWFFLPLLSHGRSTRTLTLHRQMARDPALFADVISGVYRAHNRNADEEPPPTEQETARAQVAYELLSSWCIVPGSTPEHGIDAAALNAWVDDARARCLASDREAIGDQHIGQILAHAPADADAVWPHRAVRDTIERLTSQHVEVGMSSGIFNSRGVFTKALDDGGNQERAIAAPLRRIRGRARTHTPAHCGIAPPDIGRLRAVWPKRR